MALRRESRQTVSVIEETRQGPQNQYSMDTEFHPTFKVGWKESIFDPTFDNLMSSRCTDLHLYFHS